MSLSAPEQNMASLVVLSLIAGLSACLAVFFTLSALGLLHMEAAVFSLLSGFTLGAFVYRERSLTNTFERFRSEMNHDLVRYEKQIHYYYSRSLACLAYFDAGTLLIDKVSPGFLQLLRIPSDLNVRGKSIYELLHLSPSMMEAIVSEAQLNDPNQKPHSLKLQDSEGNKLQVEVTLEYAKEQHMVEAAFFVYPSSSTQDDEEVDITSKDLDRFRRGMYRRETRIIELKEEVNEILKEAGKEPRYGFDRKLEDKNFPIDKISDNTEVP